MISRIYYENYGRKENAVMDKTDYLMRCFRHTHNKDKENYVILGIWHRLRLSELSIDLQPVTQQYVKRALGGYALLDLYFPAINLAVECDEAYHVCNKHADALREDYVFRSFAKCGIGDAKKNVVKLGDEDALNADCFDVSKLTLARVDASVSYKEIDKQLDFIAKYIIKLVGDVGLSAEWDSRSAEEVVLSLGYVRTDLRVTFRTVASILEGLNVRKKDGSLYKDWWKGGFELKGMEHTTLWFPHLSYNAGGWSNVLQDAGEKIVECRKLGNTDEEEMMRNTAREYWLKLEHLLSDKIKSVRVVFAHSKNELGESGYRFLGVYELEKIDRCESEDAPIALHWKRSSVEFSCLN